MKNFIILVGLALFMLVGCSEPTLPPVAETPEATRYEIDYDTVKVGDKGTIFATKLANGDWQFDHTGLGSKDGLNISTTGNYYASKADVGSSEIKFKILNEWRMHQPEDYLYDFSQPIWRAYAKEKELTVSGGMDIPVGSNPLMPTFTPNPYIGFNDNIITWGVASVKTYSENENSPIKTINLEGEIKNGRGDLVVTSITEWPYVK